MKRPFVSIFCVATACAGLLLVALAGWSPAASDSDDMPAAKKSTAGKSKTASKKAIEDEEDAVPDEVPEGYRREGVSEIVLWNEHNGKHHDNGAQTCNVELKLKGKSVWRREDLEIPWEANKSANRVIEVPNVKADAVRVEITAWNEKGGGLSEIEVLDKTGTNLGMGGKVTTSADRSTQDPHGGATLVDGNFYSANAETGYWLLPEGQAGWAEVELLPQKIPPPPYQPPEKKKGKKVLSRTPMPAEICVTCDESFELYINGERVLQGHGQRCFSRNFKIANGDIITVKCEGASETKGGFCFLARFTASGKHIDTPFGWKHYTPDNPDKWFDPERAKASAERAKESANVVKGTSPWAEKEMKQESGKKMPMFQIWGTGKTCYLVLVADTTIIRPKFKPGQKGARGAGS